MKKLAGSILVFVIGAFLGLLGGTWTGNAINAGALETWRDFSLHNGTRADRFIESDHPGVFVVTEEDRVFGLELSFNEAPEWIEVSRDELEVTRSSLGGWSNCQKTEPFKKDLIILQPPGKDIDTIYCIYSPHAEYDTVQRFVINEDGQVWRWLNKREGWGAMGLVVICGAAGALLAGLFLALVYASRSRS